MPDGAVKVGRLAVESRHPTQEFLRAPRSTVGMQDRVEPGTAR